MKWFRDHARLLATSFLACLFFAGVAVAVSNQLPVIQGPNGPVSTDPVAVVGFDSGTGAPCVVGKTVTCLLATSATVTGGGDASAANQVIGNTRLSTINTTLGSPFQAGGSIGNSAFGVNAQTSGGASGDTFEVAATDNHRVSKNGAGTWYGFDAWSKHSVALYIRFYDAGTGFNGCNSAANLIWEGQIPANSTPANGAGLVRPFGDTGRAFTNGLAECVTAAFGNTDTTSATASVASVNIGYK